MTLILAIQAANGIVMASDAQVTAGMVKSTTQKIKKFNNFCLWGAAGELALIQRVEEGMDGAPKEQPLRNLRDGLAAVVRDSVDALLRVDFRTKFFQGNPAELLKLHSGDFVFAQYLNNAPTILHISVDGTPEWVDKCFATGNGDLFAYALLQRYQSIIPAIHAQQASVLAFRVIQEAIEVGAYGTGPPIDVWQITDQGSQQLAEAEVAGLADAHQSLRQEEIELFMQPRQAGPPETSPVE
jgi:proteasome beta subunit